MKLKIVTPEKELQDLTVTNVTAPGEVGEFTILPGHRPLLSALKVGVLTVNLGDKIKHFAISSGIAEILSDDILLLVETCLAPEDIDIERAEKSRLKAEQKLNKISSMHDPAFKAALSAKERAENRLLVAKK